MSELLQPGHHPDADQLSAFAEHAMPEHERLITLAHLAGCSDCREIVFLAQQAMQDENPALHATPSRKPWFKSWTLLWSTAAALACGLLIMVLHSPKPSGLPQEAALGSKSPVFIPPPPTPVPQPAVLARETSSLKPHSKKALPSSRPKPASPLATTGAIPSVEGNLLSSNQAINNFPLRGRDTFALTPQSTDTKPAGIASAHGVIGGMGSQEYPAPPASTQRNSLVTFSPAQQAASPSQNQRLSQQATAPALQATSPSTQSLTPQNTNQTVDVTSPEPAIQTESAIVTAGALNSIAPSSQKIAGRSLPSKRLATSSISNGSQTLAIDSAGDLFLSKDAGVNWQHISQQWTGKAIKVTLASPMAKKQPETSKVSSGGTAASAASFGSISSASVAKKLGFDLTTDTGTTWFSLDGFIWEKR